MRIFISGICGFVGSSLARHLVERADGLSICGVDNLLRQGSEINRHRLNSIGIGVSHGDLRMASDVEALPPADWVIDAAANPSVQAGVDSRCSSRQLMEHNLVGSLNLLEYCRRCEAGLILLSSSRVYSIPLLAALPVHSVHQAFVLDEAKPLPRGVSSAGVSEEFSVAPPISLYGSSKLASEIVAQEYGETFGFPVWVNRCGVLAGAGQFGTADQGIFSYWIHAHAARRPMRYIGFDGRGWQVRDVFHPEDLADLLLTQMKRGSTTGRRLFNVGGGAPNAMSLALLTAWCDMRFRPHVPAPDPRPRRFDVPWLVMDAGLARQELGWKPSRSLESILDEIAAHARENPDWLERCGVL